MSEPTVHHGECVKVMRTMPDNSVDAIVTDPPYGIAFMSRAWDSTTPGTEWAEECLRVLKPGGHILAFGASRTWHRLAIAIEDGGFEIRDSIAWLYGSGFPKSLNVAKAIASGGGRPEDIRRLAMGDGYLPSGRGRVNYDHGGGSVMNGATGEVPLTEEAQQWEGWGTSLKPAFEPIVMGRKPFKGTVAANVLEHGAGALNIDASRIGDGSESQGERPASEASSAKRYDTSGAVSIAAKPGPRGGSPSGRWPANVILDEHTAELLDEQSGTLTSGKMRSGVQRSNTQGWHGAMPAETGAETIGDSGGASRFFYCAKAPKSERPDVDGVVHTTVKPLTLMRHLIRLVTPPGGTVLDTFAGSGTTLEAAMLEEFESIGIEQEAEYLPLIHHRIKRATQTLMQGKLL